MQAAEFDDFYAASFSRVVHQLYAMTGNHAEAQDCVQEAFIRAWSHRRRLDGDGSPEAWVRTTAYRLAVSRWRRSRLDRRSADRAVGAPVTSAAPDESRVALVAALATLPLEQRRVLVLHHLCDLSVQDVAAEVGAPVGTVKARLHRGRTALQDALAPAHQTGDAHV